MPKRNPRPGYIIPPADRRFDIRQDLESRSLATQIEILWISGPTWHDVARIAQVLEITEEDVTTELDKQGLL